MPAEVWDDAERLERYVGRWSRLVAREFVAWLNVPPGGRWLDVGCGSGALTEMVLAVAEPASVAGVDTSAAYVAYAGSRVADPRASFAVGDAQALDHPDAAFDAVASSLVLNFLPDPERGVAEMARVVRPGGWVLAEFYNARSLRRLVKAVKPPTAVSHQTHDEHVYTVTATVESEHFEACRDELMTILNALSLAPAQDAAAAPAA